MLPQKYRDLLVQVMPQVLPNPLDCRNLIDSIRPGSWAAIVPLNAPYATTVPIIIDAADGQGWLHELIRRLAASYPQHRVLAIVLAESDRMRDTVQKPELKEAPPSAAITNAPSQKSSPRMNIGTFCISVRDRLNTAFSKDLIFDRDEKSTLPKTGAQGSYTFWNTSHPLNVEYDPRNAVYYCEIEVERTGNEGLYNCTLKSVWHREGVRNMYGKGIAKRVSAYIKKVSELLQSETAWDELKVEEDVEGNIVVYRRKRYMLDEDDLTDAVATFKGFVEKLDPRLQQIYGKDVLGSAR